MMDTVPEQATRIRLLDLSSLPMRTFHMAWSGFFLVFLGWFGVAPLMAVIREDLGLTQAQIGNTIIASVAATVLVRVLIGRLCDILGPRRTFSGLLIVGAFPVMGIGLAQSYESFLLFRLAIGGVGAAFVVTQYHTAMMFAPTVVGTANATAAGWGNLGGGVTQAAMPLILAALMGVGLSASAGWRLAMLVPGAAMLLWGVVYYRATRDTPAGDFRDLSRGKRLRASGNGGLRQAAGDYRVWALFVAYAACFGIELTLNNIAALYFIDHFDLSLGRAGIVAGGFGLMNLFARSLGGIAADRLGIRFGLRGRTLFAGALLLCEGLALMLFASLRDVVPAVAALFLLSLFVQMAEGATFSVVSFVNRGSLGAVAGIVGAGGNVGAVAAGFLLRSEALTTPQALFCLGIAVSSASALPILVRFTKEEQREERAAVARALERRTAMAA